MKKIKWFKRYGYIHTLLMEHFTLEPIVLCCHPRFMLYTKWGVVVDNVRNQAMGFKIINGAEKHENVVLFDLNESLLKKQIYKLRFFT